LENNSQKLQKITQELDYKSQELEKANLELAEGRI
jgi:exonuclease VII small subunit